MRERERESETERASESEREKMKGGGSGEKPCKHSATSCFLYVSLAALPTVFEFRVQGFFAQKKGGDREQSLRTLGIQLEGSGSRPFSMLASNIDL